MVRIRLATDLEDCHNLWLRTVPPERVTDLWCVRECFHRWYQRRPVFVVAERAGELVGLLPLSWIEESRCYGFFPDETWHGKTWLEQNRILAQDGAVLEQMLAAVEEPEARYHVRYLLPITGVSLKAAPVDEIGYLFLPPRFNYDLDTFFRSFARKSAKKIQRAVDEYASRNPEVRLDDPADFDLLVQMNMDRFGGDSYFADRRFTEGFRDLMRLSIAEGWFRMTTVIVDGEPAAVDFGCVYRGTYTLMGGGTNARFPGIAKYINLFHMRRACEERYDEVDFLCGDFLWKPMFHLTPRPLFKVSNVEESLGAPLGVDAGACASASVGEAGGTVACAGASGVGRELHA